MIRTAVNRSRHPRRMTFSRPKEKMAAMANTIARPQAFFWVKMPCQFPKWPVDASSPMEGTVHASMELARAATSIVMQKRKSCFLTGNLAAKYRPNRQASTNAIERRDVVTGSCDQRDESAADTAKTALHCRANRRR